MATLNKARSIVYKQCMWYLKKYCCINGLVDFSESFLNE